MSKRTGKGNRGASKGAAMSIADKLEAKGLGIKYTTIRQNAHDPHSAPYRRPSAKENYEDPIKGYEVFPGNQEPEEDIKEFIKLHAAVQALVEDNMREVGENYYKHVLGLSSYLDKSEGEFEQMREYFSNDKLGLVSIDKTDTKCWQYVKTPVATSPTSAAAPAGSSLTPSTVSTVSGRTHVVWGSAGSGSTPRQARPTSFYTDLQRLQRDYYMYLRAGIVLFMDADAQRYYKTVIAQEDKNRNLPMAEKYKPGKRIPWEWIQNIICTKMCCHTNGNYFYKPLMTLYRKDGQSRYDWCELVKGAQQDIVNFKNGYDQIGSNDAVEKLWDWLCPEEEQPVMRLYYKRSHNPPYKDAQTILTNVTLEELIQNITIDVDNSEWPIGTPYSNAHCKAGRAKLLYSHRYVQSLRDKISDLESSKSANRRTSNRTRYTGGQSDTEHDPIMEPDMEEAAFADGDDDTPDGGRSKRQNKRLKQKRKRKKKKRRRGGKANQRNQNDQRNQSTKDKGEPCPKCLNDGLGFQYHKGKCDDNKRANAVKAMKKRITDSGKKPTSSIQSDIYKARRKGRQHKPITDYPKNACKWCMAWGWPPERTTHPENKCIYIPDGPLHKKLGGTYAQMYSSKLDSNFYNKRSEVFKEHKEARKKALKGKNAQFVGSVKRLKDNKSNGDEERVPRCDKVARVPDEHSSAIAQDRLTRQVKPTDDDAVASPAKKARVDTTVLPAAAEAEANASPTDTVEEGDAPPAKQDQYLSSSAIACEIADASAGEDAGTDLGQIEEVAFDDCPDFEFQDSEPAMEPGELMGPPPSIPFKRKGTREQQPASKQQKLSPKQKKRKKPYDPLKVRDSRDPSFFMIHYACLTKWHSFEKANKKENLVAMRRHLFNNRKEFKHVAQEVKRLPKQRRTKIKAMEWVVLPKHYAAPKNNDASDDSDGGAPEDEPDGFLRGVNAAVNAKRRGEYPEGKDELSYGQQLLVDEICDRLNQQPLAGKDMCPKEQYIRANIAALAKGDLPMPMLDQYAYTVTKQYIILERVYGLEDVNPKDWTPADKAAKRDKENIHVGAHQLFLKALVKGHLSEQEEKDLLACHFGRHRAHTRQELIQRAEYSTLLRKWKARMKAKTCPISRYRKSIERQDRRRNAARKKAREKEEAETLISRFPTGPVIDENGVEVHPLSAAKGPSHGELVASGLAMMETDSDSNPEDDPDQSNSCDEDDDKADSKGDPGPNQNPVTTSRCSAPCQPVCVPNDIYIHNTQTGEDELGFDTRKGRLRLRSKGSNSVIEIPTEAYIPAVKHARASLPVARTISVNANLKTNTIPSNEPLLSEQKGFKLLQAYMHYRDPQGRIKVGRVQLDTQSAVSYARPDCSIVRAWRPWESRTAMGIKREKMALGQPTSFTVLRKGEPVVIDTNDPHKSLDKGVVALLSLEALQKLGIDLNYHTAFTTHKPIKFLDNLTETHQQNDESLRELLEEYAQPLSAKDMCRVSNLSERVIQEYLETHENEYEKKPIHLETSLDINPDMSKEDRDKLMEVILKYRHVFASHTNTLPPEMKKVKPHEFKLKPGAKPVQVPCPRFGASKRKLIIEWVEWAKEAGLIEPADGAEYASRLHLAAKRGPHTSKDKPPDGIRITWAGVEVNDTLEKSVPTYTNAWEQIYKVAKYKYKFSADGLKQYWSIPLAKESRNITAFWTPLGLWRFKRLVMGTKNAATVAQNAYTWAMNNLLPAEALEHIAQYADDFMGGADSHASLVEIFEQFLEMASQARITINPKKVRIGYSDEQFYGYRINNGRITPADRNIEPVRKMQDPKNRSELRSVMGVFDQFSGFIKDYGKAGTPSAIVRELASTKVPYIWTERHSKALQALKDKVLVDGIWIYAPRDDLPLHLETDGSDNGWGAVLYQLVDGERHVIKMWSKKWPTEAWHKKPPYHREAKAWMEGMERTIPLAMNNRFPIECYTDHSPLTWVKHTSGKGPVSQFIIDKLSVVDYNMHYIKGRDNIVADALSRFPMLGPGSLIRTGLTKALDYLLAALVDTDIDTTKLWFDARKDTPHLVTDLFNWREQTQEQKVHNKTICTDAVSESSIGKRPYTFGIWAPPADKVTHQCAAAFKKDTAFAMLVPSDIVRYIPVDAQNNYDREVAQRLQAAGKISFLDVGLVWIIHKAPKVRQVYDVERQRATVVTDGPISLQDTGEDQAIECPDLEKLTEHMTSNNATPAITDCPDRATWIKEQKECLFDRIWKGKASRAADGLWFITGEDGRNRTIVPRTLQDKLVHWKHYSMCHMGYKKVYHELAKRFWWKGMHKMCREICQACELCALLKAKMNLAHKHFSAKLFCTPRTSYGSDYYGVRKNTLGYCQVLGIIDLATGDLVLKASKHADAAHVTHTLYHEIVLRKGVPLLFHSDAAKAFIGTAMEALSSTLGIKQTNTLAHNPKSNAKMERVWEFVGRALKAMTSEQYEQFHLYLPFLAHVWNNTPDADTKVTPFEAERGMPMRSIAESLTQNPPAEGLPADTKDLNTIAQSCKAYAKLLASIKAVEKVTAARNLNAKGHAKITYKVRDRVTFYLPPTQKQAQTMGKNPKHILQYAGPGRIIRSLSKNGTGWEISWNGRRYQRNVMHMHHYRPDQHVLFEQRAVHDNSVMVGSFVAVLDTEGDANYHVAKVIKTNRTLTVLHYMGTQSKQLRSCVWRYMFKEKPQGRQTRRRGAKPDTAYRMHVQDNGYPNPLQGELDTMPIGQSLIVLPNLGLDDHMRLTRDTILLLRELPYKHHVYMKTWT